MPAFIAALLGGFLTIAGNVAIRALLQIGFGVLIFSGLDTSLGWLKSQAVSYLQGLGSMGGVNIVSVLAFMKVGIAVNIVFSALLARIALQGFVNGTRKVLALT